MHYLRNCNRFDHQIYNNKHRSVVLGLDAGVDCERHKWSRGGACGRRETTPGRHHTVLRHQDADAHVLSRRAAQSQEGPQVPRRGRSLRSDLY